MPKRVIDFDAMWASDKLAACPAWAQAEYAWLYGLADCNGCFECTNLRVIWGRVAAIRRDLPIERLEKIFEEFTRRGLLFAWYANGKRYAHWTGSDVPGRLPPPSWRNRLERLAPPVPQRELEQYVAECAVPRLARGGVRDACEEEVGGTDADAAHRSFVARQNQRAPQDDSPSYVQQRGGNCVAHFAALSASEGLGPAEFVRRDANGATSDGAQAEKSQGTPRKIAVVSPQATEGAHWEEVSRECGGGELKAVVESAPAEDWDLSLDLEREGERHTPSARAIEPNAESRECEENPIPGLFGNQSEAIENGSAAAEKCRPHPSLPRASTTGRAIQGETQAATARFCSPGRVHSPGDVLEGATCGESLERVRQSHAADGPGFCAGSERPSSIRREAELPRPIAEADCPTESCETQGAELREKPQGYDTALGYKVGAGAARFGGMAASRGAGYEKQGGAGVTARTHQAKTPRAEELAEIWEQERGALPALRAMTPERVARCRARLAHARDAQAFPDEFRTAVRRAASTPFLCGAGPAGWRANFDWFIANGTNYCKVLEGRYDAAGAAMPDAGRTSFPPIGKPATERIANERPQGQRPCATQTLPLAPGESNPERGGEDAGYAASNQATQAVHDAGASCAPRNSFAWRDAREAAVQRELRAGSGPQLEPGAARVRPEVLERWKKRHAG
jgi:hypothetical protein